MTKTWQLIFGPPCVVIMCVYLLYGRAEIPIVKTWPATQTFVTGSTVNIACSAIAYPPPTFAWRYGDSGQIVENVEDDGRGDIPVHSGRVSTDHEGLLTIQNATQDDAGRWECIATNELGVGSDVTVLEYIGIQFKFDKIKLQRRFIKSLVNI